MTTHQNGPDLEALEHVMGHRFGDRSLLRLAITHTSYINENPGDTGASNERLEFLGDSIVNFIVGHQVYLEANELPEGQLTTMRANVVRRESLAEAARRLELGKYLIMGKGEASNGGATRPSNLANVFEAVTGAIFLDAGIQAAERFLLATLDLELAAARDVSATRDPKSQLQEELQSRGQGIPTYVSTTVIGPANERSFSVAVMVKGESYGHGAGARKLDAERAAARAALEKIASAANPSSSHAPLPAGEAPG